MGGRDLESICSAFADNAVYHNVPVKPIDGITGIRAIFQSFLDCVRRCQARHRQLAAAPGLVLAERIDYFTMNDGRKVVLPVNGVFEIRNGKIARFSDYSTSQTSSSRAASSCKPSGSTV